MFRKRKISPSIALSGNSFVRDSVQVAPNRFESVYVDAAGYSQQITHLNKLTVHVQAAFPERRKRHGHTTNSARQVTLER